MLVLSNTGDYYRLSEAEEASALFWDLLDKIFVVDPAKRITLSGIMVPPCFFACASSRSLRISTSATRSSTCVCMDMHGTVCLRHWLNHEIECRCMLRCTTVPAEAKGRCAQQAHPWFREDKDPDMWVVGEEDELDLDEANAAHVAAGPPANAVSAQAINRILQACGRAQERLSAAAGPADPAERGAGAGRKRRKVA